MTAPADPQTVDNPVDPPTAEQLDTDPDWEIIGQFEFIDRLPTDEEVLNLLASLRDVWGVPFRNYAAFLIPLPSNKKVKVDRPRADGNGTVKVDEHHEVVTLYFSVAGRLAMLNQAAEENGWCVDFIPEPDVPGPPGYLTGMGEVIPNIGDNDLAHRLVYREYIEIHTVGGERLGRRGGTAWVPLQRGSQAAGSNPYEKVETSARGRAAAAWGFGVIPGSGIASIEEMRATGAARQAIQAERSTTTALTTGRKARPDLEDELRTIMEQVRQLRGQEWADLVEKVEAYTKRAWQRSVIGPPDAEGEPTIDFGTLKDGQVVQMITQFKQQRLKAETDAAEV